MKARLTYIPLEVADQLGDFIISRDAQVMGAVKARARDFSTLTVIKLLYQLSCRQMAFSELYECSKIRMKRSFLNYLHFCLDYNFIKRETADDSVYYTITEKGRIMLGMFLQKKIVPRKILDETVHEIKKIPLKSPIIFAGFVGPGLAGPLSVGYIIEKLKMQEIGYLHSRYLPPSTVFMQGRLRHPFRFYSNKKGNICCVICEVTLKAEGLYNIASIVLDWAQSKGCRELVILDGVASEEHDSKTFCAAEEDLCRIMQDKEISMISQGFISGIPGSILNQCIIRKIRAITLLVKASHAHPDPLAAATLIDSVNKVYGTVIDTADLRKQKEKLGTEFRELSEKYKEHRQADSGMYM